MFQNCRLADLDPQEVRIMSVCDVDWQVISMPCLLIAVVLFYWMILPDMGFDFIQGYPVSGVCLPLVPA